MWNFQLTATSCSQWINDFFHRSKYQFSIWALYKHDSSSISPWSKFFVDLANTSQFRPIQILRLILFRNPYIFRLLWKLLFKCYNTFERNDIDIHINIKNQIESDKNIYGVLFNFFFSENILKDVFIKNQSTLIVADFGCTSHDWVEAPMIGIDNIYIYIYICIYIYIYILKTNTKWCFHWKSIKLIVPIWAVSAMIGLTTQCIAKR